MEKKWTLKNTDEQQVSTLQSALKIHPAFALMPDYCMIRF
jgi:hypothetical protein